MQCVCDAQTLCPPVYGGSVVTWDGPEARFAVTRSVTPKDYKMLNYDNVDPIRKLKQHLGI